MQACHHYFATARPVSYQSKQTMSTKLKCIMVAMWTTPPMFYIAAYSILPDKGFRSSHCNQYDIYGKTLHCRYAL